jgi:hypothetical protein
LIAKLIILLQTKVEITSYNFKDRNYQTSIFIATASGYYTINPQPIIRQAKAGDGPNVQSMGKNLIGHERRLLTSFSPFPSRYPATSTRQEVRYQMFLKGAKQDDDAGCRRSHVALSLFLKIFV